MERKGQTEMTRMNMVTCGGKVASEYVGGLIKEFVSPFSVLHSCAVRLACNRMHSTSDDLFYLCCICVQHGLLFGRTVSSKQGSKCSVVHSSKWAATGAFGPAYNCEENTLLNSR